MLISLKSSGVFISWINASSLTRRTIIAPCLTTQQPRVQWRLPRTGTQRRRGETLKQRLHLFGIFTSDIFSDQLIQPHIINDEKRAGRKSWAPMKPNTSLLMRYEVDLPQSGLTSERMAFYSGRSTEVSGTSSPKSPGSCLHIVLWDEQYETSGKTDGYDFTRLNKNAEQT